MKYSKSILYTIFDRSYVWSGPGCAAVLQTVTDLSLKSTSSMEIACGSSNQDVDAVSLWRT